MRKGTLFLLSLLLITALAALPAAAEDAAQPQLPHAFYGKVLVGGSPGNEGLVVEVAGPGVRAKNAGNPVTTMPGGIYGAEGATTQRLLVQGPVTPGTPLDFYIGAQHAEVYDVAAGGPWKANYTYLPGGYTELNLRIASLPGTGQTREPTPVQTPLPASAVAGGYGLPQIPDSPGTLQPQGEATPALSADNPSGTPGAGGVLPGETTSSGLPANTGTVLPASPAGSQMLLIGGGIIIVILLAGGAYYLSCRGKKGSEQAEESGKKEE